MVVVVVVVVVELGGGDMAVIVIVVAVVVSDGGCERGEYVPYIFPSPSPPSPPLLWSLSGENLVVSRSIHDI